MLNHTRIVFLKELTDVLRDRRTLLTALFSPLLGPVLMMLLFGVIGRQTAAQIEKPLELPVQGAENAPSLIHFLEQNDVILQPAPADPEAAVQAGDHEVVLIIPAGFGEDFTAGRPATVQLVIDDSRQSTQVTVNRATRLLENYSRQTGLLRLFARGISPTTINALAIERLDVSTPQSQAALFLNVLPYFLIMAAFTGGMGVAIDATAGERERGSLEPLLINPVARWELVLGKLGVAVVFALQAVLEGVAAFGLMLNFVPAEDLGVQLSISLPTLLGIGLVTIPVVLVACALQFIIASFTRNYREAQSYLTLLALIPALPGMFLSFVPFKPELWTMLIPAFSQQLLINQLMRGENIDPLFLVVSAVATLLVGGVLVAIAVRLFGREQILFAR